MKTIHEYIEKVPDYALPFLINGDDSNLSIEDISRFEVWYAKIQRQADRYQCLITISPVESCEAYFSPSPCFGLPCDVVDCTVTFLQ